MALRSNQFRHGVGQGTHRRNMEDWERIFAFVHAPRTQYD